MAIMTHAKFYFNQLILPLTFGIWASEPKRLLLIGLIFSRFNTTYSNESGTVKNQNRLLSGISLFLNKSIQNVKEITLELPGADSKSIKLMFAFIFQLFSSYLKNHIKSKMAHIRKNDGKYLLSSEISLVLILRVKNTPCCTSSPSPPPLRGALEYNLIGKYPFFRNLRNPFREKNCILVPCFGIIRLQEIPKTTEKTTVYCS